nr:signal recognition particle 54 kDa protein 2 [Ipomoea batatas]
MVLAQLGGSISRALQQMSNATIIDEKVLNECLNEITRALLQSDVQFKLVRDMQTNIKRIVNLDDLAAGHNKRKIIQQAVFNELCKILDPGKPSFTPKKGKTSVVMFVGLQGNFIISHFPSPSYFGFYSVTGSGKTTTCTKYAYYHQRKGWKPALVCADTFRAGAFDQLKQNATKAKIPFYGSYTESDPVKIAVEGVERFKKENCDLIIVDTSGRHKQEAALFEEMRQVSEATVFSMLPGFSQELMPKGREKESQAKIKRYMTMMDSMTNEELDSTNPKLMTESRIMRIARGSGRLVHEVMEMMEEYKRLAKIWSKMKGLKIPKKGDMSALSRNMNAQHMSKVLPPQMLKQIGGMGGLQNLMKQMGSAKDMMGMFGGADK